MILKIRGRRVRILVMKFADPKLAIHNLIDLSFPAFNPSVEDQTRNLRHIDPESHATTDRGTDFRSRIDSFIFVSVARRPSRPAPWLRPVRGRIAAKS